MDFKNESSQREPGALMGEVYRKFLRMLGTSPSIYRSKYNLLVVLNDNSWWISKDVNDLDSIVKLVRSVMCYLKFIKKTLFKVSRNLW